MVYALANAERATIVVANRMQLVIETISVNTRIRLDSESREILIAASMWTLTVEALYSLQHCTIDTLRETYGSCARQP